MTILEHFQWQCVHHGNISEHLPTLKRYAEQCEHITELGVCGIGSTWAFMAANPKRILSVDPLHPQVWGANLGETETLAKKAGVEFRFIQADDLTIEPEATDLLFIDTAHNYTQLKKELALFASKTSRLIIMHDTETFGYKDESGNGPGLNRAIDEFLCLTAEGRQWQMIERRLNCHGLMVLERREPKLRIKAFTFFYNEEALIPFYLSHYWWVDEIHAVVSESSDRTLELLQADPRVIIEGFEFPGGYDHACGTAKMNEIISQKEGMFDWYMVPECDELVWPIGNPFCTQARLSLEGCGEEVLVAKMWQVYRNAGESDLDATMAPVALQRRHGDSDRENGINALYRKPLLFRPNRGIQFNPGLHSILEESSHSRSIAHWDGVHWANADEKFCIERRIRNRRDHIKKSDLEAGMGAHNKDVDEASLHTLCESHMNDPKLF